MRCYKLLYCFIIALEEEWLIALYKMIRAHFTVDYLMGFLVILHYIFHRKKAPKGTRFIDCCHYFILFGGPSITVSSQMITNHHKCCLHTQKKIKFLLNLLHVIIFLSIQSFCPVHTKYGSDVFLLHLMDAFQLYFDIFSCIFCHFRQFLVGFRMVLRLTYSVSCFLSHM